MIRGSRNNLIAFWLPAILSGLMLTAAFPNIGFSGTAWIALLPLLWVVNRRKPSTAFRAGFIAGLAHYLTLMYWLVYTMHTYGGLPWLLSFPVLFLLASYLALYTAVFSAGVSVLCTTAMRRMFWPPVLWVALEYTRSFLMSGMPWELLGYSQYRRIHLIQIADISGVYGVSFLIVLVNSTLFVCLDFLNTRRLDRQNRIPFSASACALLICIAAFAGTWAYGARQIRTMDQKISVAPVSRVSVIQANVDQSIKWDPAFQRSTTETYITLSKQAKSEHPDLIVWPETATPFYLQQDIGLTAKIRNAVQSTGASFLIGSPSFMQRQDLVEYFNSAYLVSSNGMIREKYDKSHLVPFGEYVPCKKLLPFVDKMVAGIGDFTPGPQGCTLSWESMKLGVQICFEIIFPDLSRKAVKNGAQMLINITNDAWFGKSAAPYQHFSMAVFRAVENKRCLVRSANTGISGLIDPIGRIVTATPIFRKDIATFNVSKLHDRTIYTVYGDGFAIFCLTVAGIAGIWYGVILNFFGRHTRHTNSSDV